MSKIVRLTESDLIRLIKRLVNESEQPSSTDCLTKAGFKKGKGGVARNQVGKPMPIEGVYEGTYEGKRTILLPSGIADIQDKNNFVNGKWKCENGKLVIFNIKTTPMPKRPF